MLIKPQEQHTNKKGTTSEIDKGLHIDYVWHSDWDGIAVLDTGVLQVILGIFLALFGLGLCGFLHRLAKHIEQRDYERERFALMVAQELDRLDKAIKENNANIVMAESMLEPQKKWWGRN